MLIRGKRLTMAHLARHKAKEDPVFVSLCGRLTGRLKDDPRVPWSGVRLVDVTDVGTRYRPCSRCEYTAGHPLTDAPPVIQHQRSLPQRTIELYLRYREVRATAQRLDAEEYRLPDGRRIREGNISDLLYAEASDIAEDQRERAIDLYLSHFNAMIQRYQ